MKETVAAIAIFMLLNIPEAVTVCQELNMTLAGFETLEEYEAVTEYIRIDLASTDIWWTSGTLQHTMWIWANSGTPFSYFKWDVNEPDSNTEDTLCILKGFMHNWVATGNARFICEETTSC